MNVDLLQDNPDWRWYILFACASVVITGITWLISKCSPVSIVVLDYVIAETDTHTLLTVPAKFIGSFSLHTTAWGRNLSNA